MFYVAGDEVLMLAAEESIMTLPYACYDCIMNHTCDTSFVSDCFGESDHVKYI